MRDDDRLTAPLTKRKTHDSVTNRPRDVLSVCQCIAHGGDNHLGFHKYQAPEQVHDPSITAGPGMEGCHHYLVVTPASDLVGVPGMAPSHTGQDDGYQLLGCDGESVCAVVPGDFKPATAMPGSTTP